MKNILLIVSAFVAFNVFGQVNPTPQHIYLQEKKIKPTHFQLKENHSVSDISFLRSYFSNQKEKKYVMNVYIGDKSKPFAKKYIKKVPQKSEGYYLCIDEKNIYVIGYDSRGVYYGTRTLEQLLSNSAEVPMCEIIDFPDLPHRGVVEGFYGTPWSHEKRIRQIEFYGKNKLNTYIYGPKDDPYHSSPNWRLPYPEKEALQIKELVQKSNENFVDFVWAIHPGKDIKWNDEDRKNLINKFELMYNLGVRAFAVFFDDISGEGTNPEKQAELLNYINNQFITKKKDVNPLIMCPTEYNKSWANPQKRYLEILGENLHPNIEIMWTGDRVVADISKETLAWINPKIKRKAYIWWNFPVSDYVRNHLLLGAVYGNGLDIKSEMSGFVSNPMEHPEASKIAIYSVADYTWNVEKFQSETSWKRAISNLLPKNSEALFTFAKHNSDLGANGHLYRRVESVDFKPITEKFLSEFDKYSKNSQLKKVSKEFQEIISASEKLETSSENEYLNEEIRNWVLQFKLLGKKGVEIIKMYEKFGENNTEDFKKIYQKVKNIQQEMFVIDQNANQNPYQPGIKVATLVIEPFLDNVLENLIKEFNKKYNENLRLLLIYNPNSLITNVEQLKNQPLQQKGKLLFITPLLEYVRLSKNDFIGIELEKITDEELKLVRIDLEKTDIFSEIKIQTSIDGREWKNVDGKLEKNQWVSSGKISPAKFVRIINLSEKTIEFKLKKFEIVQ